MKCLPAPFSRCRQTQIIGGNLVRQKRSSSFSTTRRTHYRNYNFLKTSCVFVLFFMPMLFSDMEPMIQSVFKAERAVCGESTLNVSTSPSASLYETHVPVRVVVP